MTLKSKDLFVVVSVNFGVDTETQNLFNSKEEAEEWRIKNIDPKHLDVYKVLSLMEWISLIKNEAFEDGKYSSLNGSY